MDQGTLIAIVVGVLVLAVIGWLVWQRQRSEQLKQRYGPEYARTVNELGDTRRAESELIKRQERVAALDIRPLTAAQLTRFQQQWRAVQTRFVDDPKAAVTDADALVEDAMRTRGYPVSDFDQRAADLSVHHPRVVENYRAARDIAHRHRRGEATTEDLRQAMVYYRGLFQDLLEDHEHAGDDEHAEDRERHRDVAAPRAGDERAVERAAASDERVIDRTAARDDGATEIPIRRVGEQRSSDRDISNDREVRP
jgi:hypothetical protein